MDKVIHIQTSHQDTETAFYSAIHREIKLCAGKLTPAQINGILFQVKLEVLDVFNTDDEGYTA